MQIYENEQKPLSINRKCLFDLEDEGQGQHVVYRSKRPISTHVNQEDFPPPTNNKKNIYLKPIFAPVDP